MKSFYQAKLYLNFKIWNLNFLNVLKWRNDQNKSCRSRKVMQLYSWQLFHLKSSCHGKLRLNFSNLKFKFCKRSWVEKLQNKSCRSQKVIKLCSWQLFHLNSFGSQILISKSDEHKMGRTKASFGHKRLTGAVVRQWIWEAGGQGFKCQWQLSSRVSQN